MRNKITRRAAIGADDLRNGMVLLGDAISPTRYAPGSEPITVNHEVNDLVLVIVNGEDIDFNASNTVYVLATASGVPLVVRTPMDLVRATTPTYATVDGQRFTIPQE